VKLIDSSGVSSPLLIVGDYPTNNEYVNGNAFTGASGHLVDTLFAPKRVSGWYKTYYYKAPIPGYASPIKKVRQEALARIREAENWDSILAKELHDIKPNAILAMGELALDALTEEKGIGKWRGSILHLHPRFNLPDIKVIPTLSAREIWEQNDKPMVYCQWDIQKALRMMDYVKRYETFETIWIANNSSGISNWWDSACRADFITVDIETHRGFITCVGFSSDGNSAFSVPLLIGPHMDYSERGRIYKILKEILESKVPKVNQNMKYDWTCLQQFGIEVNNIVGDTMLMAHTIYPELDKNLGFLNSIYTDLPYYKDEGKKFDPTIHSVERLLKYNARDALCTWRIWKLQQDDADSFGVKEFYFKHVHPSFFTYKRMDDRGIRVDNSRRQALLQKYQPLLWDIQTTINLVAEEKVNVNSYVQVGRFIYEILKCPKRKHPTTGGKEVYSTDEKILEDVIVNGGVNESQIKMIRQVILARKLHNVINFLEVPISTDGRMRTSYKLHGTETGRTSAGKYIEPHYEICNGKVIEVESGGSFQTIPKHGYEFGAERFGADLRSIFVPSPGYCFIEGDQKQAEDRVVCVLAEDWEGLQILNKTEFKKNKFGLKDDRHTLTACLITSKPFDEITEDDRQLRGKKPRHAGNYDMTPAMLAVQTQMHYGHCVKIMEKFHSDNPKIRGIFHEGIKHELLKRRKLVTPHGRRRDFFGRIDAEMNRQAYSTIPQATVSDHTKFTILAGLINEFPEPMMFPLSESHDSLMSEVRLDCIEFYSDAFRRICETPINFIDCSLSRDYNLVIPADIVVYKENWGEKS
jgi:DNA polymerase I-like protein with 3'-5' exonuclease and polymerase domains/uracil-DNA glycosylase